MYKILREEGATNPNPVVFSGRKARTTSRQIQKPFLCESCDGLLSENGERLIAPNCARIASFPLLDKLVKIAPVVSGPDLAAFDLRDLFGADADCFTYFSASVFWRASATTWSDEGRKLDLIKLGKYEEAFRRYLLAEDRLPREVAIIMVVSTDARQVFITVPDSVNRGGFHHHQFFVPGIAFHAFVGNVMPEDARRCAMNSGRSVLAIRGSMANSGLQRWFMSTMPTIELSRKLREKYGK